MFRIKRLCRGSMVGTCRPFRVAVCRENTIAEELLSAKKQLRGQGSCLAVRLVAIREADFAVAVTKSVIERESQWQEQLRMLEALERRAEVRGAREVRWKRG
jgi:hypothetical protein